MQLSRLNFFAVVFGKYVARCVSLQAVATAKPSDAQPDLAASDDKNHDTDINKRGAHALRSAARNYMRSGFPVEVSPRVTRASRTSTRQADKVAKDYASLSGQQVRAPGGKPRKRKADLSLDERSQSDEEGVGDEQEFTLGAKPGTPTLDNKCILHLNDLPCQECAILPPHELDFGILFGDDAELPLGSLQEAPELSFEKMAARCELNDPASPFGGSTSASSQMTASLSSQSLSSFTLDAGKQSTAKKPRGRGKKDGAARARAPPPTGVVEQIDPSRLNHLPTEG